MSISVLKLQDRDLPKAVRLVNQWLTTESRLSNKVSEDHVKAVGEALQEKHRIIAAYDGTQVVGVFAFGIGEERSDEHTLLVIRLHTELMIDRSW